MNEKKLIVETPQKKLNYTKRKLLRIMDEVLLDSVDHLLKFSLACQGLIQENSEKAVEQIEEINEKVHSTLLVVEYDICLLNMVDIEKYYEDVTYYDNKGDHKVKARLDRLGKLIESALRGEKIVVNFDFPPELTKDLAVKLYKLILSSHLHLHYSTLQRFIKDHPRASQDELKAAIYKDEERKTKRRNAILERLNIPKKSHQDYRTVLNGAYYTYSTHDEIFKTEMDGVLQLYNSIYQLILSKALIDELKLDPMTMDETLFNEFYKRLEQKYIKGLTLPSLI